MSTVVPLTGATRAQLPPPCVDCVFWQDPRAVSDAARKDVWVRAADRRGEPFGRLACDAGGVAGMVQYGRGSHFPRARRLPAGPVSGDAALLSCSYLVGSDPEATYERLVLEALADLQARDFRAVESFALRYPAEVPRYDRITGHHTLFDHDLLERLGFTPLRRTGQVALMRLELSGLERGPDLVERLARGLRRLAPAARPVPSPG